MQDSRDVFIGPEFTEPADVASHALVVGINEYSDDAIPNLRFARSDAEGVRDTLEDPEFGGFKHVTALLDDDATRERIIEAITVDLARKAQPDDRVVIFFAGHGAPWRRTSAYSDGFEKYLLPSNARLSSLPATAISMQDLQRHLQYIAAKRLVIFLDACYSGATSGAVGTRGIVDPALGFRTVGMTDEYLDQISGEGRVVITACGASEVAIELPELGHGLFTKHVLDGLRGAADVSPTKPSGIIDLDSLYNYVYQAVRTESLSRSSPMNPIRRGDSVGRIVLARYTTQARRDAMRLSADASRAVDDGHLYDAVELWTRVVKLDATNHARTELERARARLAEARRLLIELEMDGRLPAVEYTRASRLLNRRDDQHDAVDRIIIRHLRRLLTPGTDFDCVDYLHAVEAATSASGVDGALEDPKPGGVSTTHDPALEQGESTVPDGPALEDPPGGVDSEEQQRLALTTLLSGLELRLRPRAQRTQGKVRWEVAVTNRNAVRIEQLLLRLDRSRLGTIALKPDETRTFHRTSRYKKPGRRERTLEAILETASGLTLATSVVGTVDIPDEADDGDPVDVADTHEDETTVATVPRWLSWPLAVTALVAGSIGSAFLARWIVAVCLSPFGLTAPAASTDPVALSIAGLAWGIAYVLVGADLAHSPWAIFFAPFIGYLEAFDGPGEFVRGILSAPPINFVLSWGLANVLATYGASQLALASRTVTYAVYSIFGVIVVSGIIAFLNEEL